MQAKDRRPVKEINRCPNTEWAAVTRPHSRRPEHQRRQRPKWDMLHCITALARLRPHSQTKTEVGHIRLLWSCTGDHLKTIYFVWRSPLKHAPLTWEPPWHVTQDRFTYGNNDMVQWRVNNREADDLKRDRAHYDFIVMERKTKDTVCSCFLYNILRSV